MTRKELRRILYGGRKIKCPACGKKADKGTIEHYGGRCYACARQKWIEKHGPLSDDDVWF